MTKPYETHAKPVHKLATSPNTVCQTLAHLVEEPETARQTNVCSDQILGKHTISSCAPATRPDAGCQALTKLVRKPKVVSEEVGHVVVQPFQHVQGIIYEEDGVIISV